MIRKIFCGGRFPFDCRDENYIEQAKQDYRAFLLKDVKRLLERAVEVKINDRVLYVGPFYFETKDMCDKDIVACEVEMIKECTDAIFLLEDGSCPGTVGEMVFAAGLGKHVIVFYVVDEKETESVLQAPCWHPMLLTRCINVETDLVACEDQEDAVFKIMKYINEIGGCNKNE